MNLLELLRENVNVFSNEREDGLHPSQLSLTPYCLRKHCYEKKVGRTTSPDLQARFNIGHVLHDFYRDHYWKHVIVENERRVCFDYKGHKVVGHCDSIMVLNGKKYILEIKTMSADTWNMIRYAQQTHINQLHYYMYGTGIHAGYLVYINKDTGSVKEFDIPYNRNTLQECLDLVEEVGGLDLNGELPDRHKKCTNGSKMRAYCAYASICYPEDE